LFPAPPLGSSSISDSFLFFLFQTYTSGNATIALSKWFFISIKFDNAPPDLSEAVERTQNFVYHGSLCPSLLDASDLFELES